MPASRLPLLLLLAPAIASAETPLRIVHDSLEVPAGVDAEQALASVEDIARIFELYEPAIPWVPGVHLELEKQVVSEGQPCVLELPVTGNAAGKTITERARVTATATETACGTNGDQPGRTITLDFDDSTYNIDRRIDRIEILACLEPVAADGERRITAVGKMYAGFKPEDPELNALMESIGAKAIQGAFLRQVDPILSAVQLHWKDLGR